MCNRHSFCLTRAGKVIDGWGIEDSHTTIMEWHGLGANHDGANAYEWQPPEGWPSTDWSDGLTVDREAFTPKKTHLKAMERHIKALYPTVAEWEAADVPRIDEARTHAEGRLAGGEYPTTVPFILATAGDRGTATAGDYGTATAGDYGTATAGDYGTATAGDRGTATAGYRGTVTAGYYGTATAGDYGTATAGDGGTVTAGDRGTATAGDYGTATAGDGGTVTAGGRGTATAGDYGTATAGYRGTVTAGYRGTVTAGYHGTATAGDYGTATAGDGGTATAGDGGTIQVKWHDGNRYRLATGYVGEDGIEANTAYFVKSGKLVEKK